MGTKKRYDDIFGDGYTEYDENGNAVHYTRGIFDDGHYGDDGSSVHEHLFDDGYTKTDASGQSESFYQGVFSDSYYGTNGSVDSHDLFGTPTTYTTGSSSSYGSGIYGSGSGYGSDSYGGYGGSSYGKSRWITHSLENKVAIGLAAGSLLVGGLWPLSLLLLAVYCTLVTVEDDWAIYVRTGLCIAIAASTVFSMLSNSGAMRQASAIPRLVITVVMLVVATVLTYRQIKN